MPRSDDKRYTLAEAERELARRECAQTGHSYDVLEELGVDGPVCVVCRRCGKSWPVEVEREAVKP